MIFILVMALYPDVQARAQAVIDRMIGDPELASVRRSCNQ